MGKSIGGEWEIEGSTLTPPERHGVWAAIYFGDDGLGAGKNAWTGLIGAEPGTIIAQ